MNDLKLNSQGDLKITNYDLSIISGIEQIVQNVTIRLKFFLGEWFLDIESGISYYDDFFIKAPNEISIESLLKQEILDTEGISELTSFKSDFNSSLRQFSVNFSALTDEGEINLEITIP